MNQEPVLPFQPLRAEDFTIVAASADDGGEAPDGRDANPSPIAAASAPPGEVPQPEADLAAEAPPQELVAVVDRAEGAGAVPHPSDALARCLTTILTRIDACDHHLEDLARVARDRERMLDRLHEENQGLKNRDRERAMLPLLKDLIRLYDDVGRTSAEYTGDDEVSRKAAWDLKLYRDAAADILARQGIETYMTTAGDAFDPARHRAIGAKTTADPALDKRIARVLKPGFATDVQVIRAAEVEVFRLAAAPTSPAH
jgi:molecular chaperone GrpE (heat shock protein)